MTGTVARRLRLGVALALALGVLASPAFADDTADARQHFRRGAELYKQAQYTDAITEFQAAYRLRPAGALRFNVAQCYEKLGDIPNAIRGYRDYLREVPSADDRSTVETAVSNLEARLAQRGHQALLVYTTPSNAAVAVDGTVVGTSPISVELLPGTRQVQVALLGYRPFTQSVLLSKDHLAELDIELHPGSQPEVAAAPPPSAPPSPAPQHVDLVAPPPPPPASSASAPMAKANLEPEPTPSKPRLWTWVAASAAGVAMTAAIIEGVSANANASKLHSSAATDPNRAGYYSGAQGDATAANVLYGVAGVAGAGAIALFFIEGSF